MALKGKFLHTEKVVDYPKFMGNEILFSLYGVFDTTSTLWSYWVISHSNGKLTNDLCTSTLNLNVDVYNVKSGKNFKTKEEGIQFIKEFKIKWETGSNDTLSEMRDRKIDNIIN